MLGDSRSSSSIAWASGSDSNTGSILRFLLPSRNSTARYWLDWNPEELPRKPRNCEYSVGVRVASTDHCSVRVFWMCLTRAMAFSAEPRSSERSQAAALRSSCRTSLSHSSVVWCWMMNSISSWCSGALTGCWALRSVGSCR